MTRMKIVVVLAVGVVLSELFGLGGEAVSGSG